MWDRRIGAVPVIDGDDRVLAAEDRAGGRKVVDHLVDWRVPGYV